MKLEGRILWAQDDGRFKVVCGRAPRPSASFYVETNPDGFREGDKVEIEIRSLVEVIRQDVALTEAPDPLEGADPGTLGP